MDTDWTKIAFKRAQRMSDNQGKVEVQNLEAYGSVRGACIGLMNDLDSELFMTSKDHLVSHSHLPSNRWDFAPYNPATFFAAPEEGVYSIEGLEALGMHIADSVGLLFGHYEKPSERTNAFPAMLSLPHYSTNFKLGCVLPKNCVRFEPVDGFGLAPFEGSNNTALYPFKDDVKDVTTFLDLIVFPDRHFAEYAATKMKDGPVIRPYLLSSISGYLKERSPDLWQDNQNDLLKFLELSREVNL